MSSTYHQQRPLTEYKVAAKADDSNERIAKELHESEDSVKAYITNALNGFYTMLVADLRSGGVCQVKKRK